MVEAVWDGDVVAEGEDSRCSALPCGGDGKHQLDESAAYGGRPR